MRDSLLVVSKVSEITLKLLKILVNNVVKILLLN